MSGGCCWTRLSFGASAWDDVLDADGAVALMVVGAASAEDDDDVVVGAVVVEADIVNA